MKLSKVVVFGGIAGLLLTGIVQAVTVNIDTAKDSSGKSISSNTVNEGRIVINGKVIQGSSRTMTPKEEKAFKEKLNGEMKNLESELEGMFD